MAYLELRDVDVDGCGTDVTAILEVDEDHITRGMVSRITNAINDYKRKNNGEYDSNTCFEVAYEVMKADGYKVRYIIPEATVEF